MPFEEIDQLFDAVVERIDGKKPLVKGPYDTHPLGQDHFLLKKSWAYFKERIKALESHYEEQLSAKKEEISALEKQIKIKNEYLSETEEKNKFLNAFQENFARSRSVDFLEMQKAQEKLRIQWGEERLNLENKILALERELSCEKKRHENVYQVHQDKERKLQRVIDDLKTQLLLKSEENAQVAKESARRLMEHEEIVRNREEKINLMRGEISRCNDQLKKQGEEIVLWEKRTDAMIKTIDELKRELDSRDQKIDQLFFKIHHLQEEKEGIRNQWRKDEASWRELWDRLRSSHDKDNSRH